MVILETDHPIVVAAELKIRLPKAVAMFSLETLRSPGLPRLVYWMVQARLTDNVVSMVMVYAEALMIEVTSYLAGTPTVPSP
jgi:hypothetical protein